MLFAMRFAMRSISSLAIPSLLLCALAGVLALAPAASGADAQDGVADPYALSAAGDPDKGRLLFNRCRACHTLSADAPPRPTGPHLDRIFGRAVAADASFTRYSAALKQADFSWTEQRLDEWLANPRSFLPGNKMNFAGIRDAQDRKDLIAYLRQATAAADAASQSPRKGAP
ncbi:MAG: cytochrome c family protein [Alphaproteobacteria bacterium]|nr:MAG: cytochrome c family protein [Alphaproteobacteria bacterium]